MLIGKRVAGGCKEPPLPVSVAVAEGASEGLAECLCARIRDSFR
jgi:hypothetical protein